MRDCSAERANAQPDGVWHLAHGKTVRVFPHDLNQPAAAAPFASGKRGELRKKERQAMPVSLSFGAAEGSRTPLCSLGNKPPNLDFCPIILKKPSIFNAFKVFQNS